MDGSRFDSLTKGLTAPGSRRRALGGLLAGTLGLLGAQTEQATGKKKPCPPCKKRKAGKCKKKLPDGTACLGGACQSGSCVTGPAGPVTTADAACPGPYADNFIFARQAQTFRALRSGQLTSASVELAFNVEGADFDMEIWSVNQANEPSAFLAGTTILNVPTTPFPGPPRTLLGTFPTTAKVAAGVRYALVVSGQPGQPFSIWLHTTNACPEGSLFFSDTPNGAFTSAPTHDMGFATFVTA